MKSLLISILLAMIAVSNGYSQTVLQVWNFAEDVSSGLADNKSDQGLAIQFLGTDTNGSDTVASDGGFTVSRADGFSGNRPFGIALNDSNTTEITLSVTLNNWDFSNGSGDEVFKIRLKNVGANSVWGDLTFQRQDINDRMRLQGTAVAGVAFNAESSSEPITYGLTLDLENDSYTYWIGTPTADNSTWVSRFNAHTGSITDLGSVDIDSVQWAILNHSVGNGFVLDQISISYIAAVPEPSTYAFSFGIFAFGIVLYRRYRR